MTGRLPACEDSAAITARLRELQAERMAAIAGCICGTLGPTQHDVAGNVVHEPTCPLRAVAPSKMEMAREAMRRARARLQRGQPARLILPSNVPLTDADMDNLRALWVLQTECPPLTADDIIARLDWRALAEKYARHRVLS